MNGLLAFEPGEYKGCLRLEYCKGIIFQRQIRWKSVRIVYEYGCFFESAGAFLHSATLKEKVEVDFFFSRGILYADRSPNFCSDEDREVIDCGLCKFAGQGN